MNNTQEGRITDFVKDGKRTYYLTQGDAKVYVDNFEVGDTRVDPKNGKTEKYTENGWNKYDIDAELKIVSEVSFGEYRR